MKKIFISVLVGLLIIGVAVSFFLIRVRISANKHSVEMQKVDSGDTQQILYYTCGMHPSVKVSVEDYKNGKRNCPICGMNLTPVYKGKGKEEGVIALSPQETSLVGVKTAKVEMVTAFKEIRTVGVVAFDPWLMTAEEEYLQALKAYKKILESSSLDAQMRAKEVLDSAKLRLELLGVSEEWIKEIEGTGKSHKNLILPDRHVWVYADVYEYEAIWPQIGDKVTMSSEVEPSVILNGEIKGIEPIVGKNTRSLKLKILADNKERILKPNMYVDVFLRIDVGEVLCVPKDAVLDTGIAKIVWVDKGNGRYERRNVVVGPELMAYMEGNTLRVYPVSSGLQEGEWVVTKANFLIDSQSQITGEAASAYSGALDKPSSSKHHNH